MIARTRTADNLPLKPTKEFCSRFFFLLRFLFFGLRDECDVRRSDCLVLWIRRMHNQNHVNKQQIIQKLESRGECHLHQYTQYTQMMMGRIRDRKDDEIVNDADDDDGGQKVYIRFDDNDRRFDWNVQRIHARFIPAIQIRISCVRSVPLPTRRVLSVTPFSFCANNVATHTC